MLKIKPVHILSLFFILIFLSIRCKNSKKEIQVKKTISDTGKFNMSQNRKDTIPLKLTWVDSSIIDYIKNSNNEFLKFARDSNIVEQWMLDTEYRRGRIYIVAEIGHDNDFTFVPDSWLYIDSLSRKVFEYDTINDTLIKWKR